MLLLRLKGYRIVARRYKTPVGEIDLVALKGKRLAFVEVKRRKSLEDAAWTLPTRQRRRIVRAAQYWLAAHPDLRRPRHRLRRGAGRAVGLAALYRERVFRVHKGAPWPSKSPSRWTPSSASISGAISPSRSCSKRNGAATTSSTTRPTISRCATASSSPKATASPSRTSRATIIASRIRATSISPNMTWCISAKTRPSTWPTSPRRISWSVCSPRTLVVNDPAAVRNSPEKIFVLDFLDLMPPTLVTRSPEQIRAFRAEHKDIVVKPLYGNGGAAIFRIPPGDTNLNSLIELMGITFREPIMVQQYVPEVRQGDKRIILVDGEIAGAINRVPPPDETRSNLHVGGTRAADHADQARQGNLRADSGRS